MTEGRGLGEEEAPAGDQGAPGASGPATSPPPAPGRQPGGGALPGPPEAGPGAGGAPLQVRGGRPRRRWRRLLVYAAFVGPGLVAAQAGNDAGGVITYASAGSQYGYRTLFLMVLVTIAYVVVQEMTARLATFTGRGLAALIREEFPIRATAFAVIALVIANMGLVVTEFAGIGSALELLGVSRYVSVPVAGVLIWLLVSFGSYRYAERVFLLMTVAFVAYPIAAVLGHPHWGTVGADLVTPHFLATRGFVLFAVALIGTTITPYIQLYVAGAVVDRGVEPDQYPLQRVDAIAGAIFSDIVSILIIVATGAAIGGSGALSSAKQAAGALRPVVGSGAEVLFGLGLLGASALAAAVVPLSTSYAVAEAIGVERSVSRKIREAPLFLGLFSAQLAFGMLVVLIPGNLISLIVNAQVLEGVISPVILGFILVLANRRGLLGRAANGRIFSKVALACVGSVAILSAVVVVQTILGWLGI
ncbi:MAG: Nramp family divalent metal transporter [Acidimicrobiales bacterium]